ncbi:MULTISPECIES: acyl carrier protein [unclassified Nocardia]|uniref:acyl carrier protein n=1 Tax=unclassified Nocardia TaxID=2637762 RepID=UPI0035E11319
MAEFTRTDLNRLLRQGAGVDEAVDLDGDVLDTPFDELGYDSLALLELASRLKTEFGITIPDAELIEMKTPRIAVQVANSYLVEA